MVATVVILIGLLVVSTQANPSILQTSSKLVPIVKSLNSPSLLTLRGGVEKSKVNGKKNINKKKTSFQSGLLEGIKDIWKSMKPATRTVLSLVLFCSIIHSIGLPAPAIFSINRSKWYEIWRPFTAVTYLGPPSLSLANNIFFLVNYGQSLEIENGTGTYSWFLFVQTAILTMLGLLFGYPYLAQALLSSIIYTSSRVDPMGKRQFQFGITITSYQLPFCMMVFDCLAQQSLQAAVPHILGIFSGHIYHFANVVWPKLGGITRLDPPKWWLKRFGDKLHSNIPGVDFRNKSNDNAPGNRKKQKGKKLI